MKVNELIGMFEKQITDLKKMEQDAVLSTLVIDVKGGGIDMIDVDNFSLVTVDFENKQVGLKISYKPK